MGSTTALLSYDGGDGTSTVYAAAGPMWEVDTTMSAVFSVGVGTFAASGLVGVNQTTTSTGVVGEDKHVLISNELPQHTHDLTYNGKPGVFFDSFTQEAGGDSNPSYSFNQSPPATNTSTGINTTTNLGHNTLPPFYGVYFIKRTARIYYAK